MNEKGVFNHLMNVHDKERRDLLEELYEVSFDVTVLHEQMHEAGTEGHTHEQDGSISKVTKTVLGDKNITLTDGGWSFDSNPMEALQELNKIINDRPLVEFRFVNENGIIKGSLYHKEKSVTIEGPDFLSAVQLLLGEIYNFLDERATNE